MSYAATVADGTQLLIGSPLVLVQGVDALDGPGLNRAEVDATAISDTSQVKLSGKAKIDDVTFNLRYDSNNTQHQALRDAARNNSQVTCQILLTDSGAEQLDFTATVPVFKHMAQQDSPSAVAVVLRPNVIWTTS